MTTRCRPNLTLNLGLRYQIQTGWSEVKGNEASFDPTVQNPTSTTLGAIWYGSTHANGRTRLQEPVYDTFLPRVGFSYRLDPTPRIRGGFGLYAYNWSNDTYNGAWRYGSGLWLEGQRDRHYEGALLSLSAFQEAEQTSHTLPATTDPAGYNGSNVNFYRISSRQ